MVASDKIEEAKKCFGKINKSGRNHFQKYNYYETRDIFPIVREVCQKFKLKTKFNEEYLKIGDTFMPVMVLRITDCTDGTWEEYHMRLPTQLSSDARKFMQDNGSCQTYVERYLYMRAFEIAEPDSIDKKDTRKKAVKPKQRPVKKQIKKVNVAPQKQETVVKPVIEPTDDEITEQDVKEALDHIYTLITTNGGEFNEARAIFQLNRQYNKKPELVNACKNALKTYTADKIKTGEAK